MNDDLFGILIYDYGFEGKMSIKLFGKEWDIILQINTEEEEIADSQRNVYLQFVENKEEVLRDVENSIFEYYQDVFETYRNQISDDIKGNLVAPKINSKYELAKLVKPESLIIDYDFEGKIPQRYGFIMEASWEPSHGLGVRIEKNKVVEVGFQDVIL